MRENMLPLLAWIIFSGVTLTFAAATNNSTSDTFNILKSPIISKPGCPSKCGDLIVPYPFGIGLGSGCGVGGWFELNCSGAFDPPRAYIGNIEIYEISDTQIRISNVVARKCYDRTGAVVQTTTASTSLEATPYSHSVLNNFIVVGCDDFGVVNSQGDSGTSFISGCGSRCSRSEDVTVGSCSGKGCCQTSLSNGQRLFSTELRTFNNHTAVSSFNPCSYAFLGELDRFYFRGVPDFSDPNFMERIRTSVPLVLDWAIGNLTCGEVESSGDYACKGNSFCVDSYPGLGGYRCSCNKGYEGNPYLDPGFF